MDHDCVQVEGGSMRYRGLAAALLLAASLAACSSTPVGVVASVEAERERGEETTPAFVQANGGLYSNAGLSDYLDEIIVHLSDAASIPAEYGQVTVGVLDTNVPNAYTVQGGDIFVSRGMIALAADESELAGALAHELAHVSSRHVAKRQAATERLVSDVVRKARSDLDVGGSLSRKLSVIEAGIGERLDELSSYSSQQELEADRIAVGILETAGYDPAGFAKLLQRLNDWQEWKDEEAGFDRMQAQAELGLKGYPDIDDRLAALSTGDRSTPTKGSGDRLMALIDGIPYDDVYHGGYIRDRRYWHPELAIAFDVPVGLAPVHTGMLAFLSSHGTIQARLLGKGVTLDTIPKIESDEMAKFLPLQSGKINEFPVLSGSGTIRQGSDDVLAKATWIDLGGQVAIVYMTVAGSDGAALDRLYTDIVGSIRRVDPKTMPSRRFHTARRSASTDTVAKVAASSSFGKQAERQVRLWNGLTKDEELHSRDWVKSIR